MTDLISSSFPVGVKVNKAYAVLMIMKYHQSTYLVLLWTSLIMREANYDID